MNEPTAARRTVARRLHPDLGGDLREYIRAMALLDDQFSRSSATPLADRTEVHIVTRRRPLSSLTHSADRAATKLRTRLPRSWPGARRYGPL